MRAAQQPEGRSLSLSKGRPRYAPPAPRHSRPPQAGDGFQQPALQVPPAALRATIETSLQDAEGGGDAELGGGDGVVGGVAVQKGSI
jgi:hypothetical protein